MTPVMHLIEIADKDANRPRLINPANIDEVIPGDNGSITICFHGGSTWTVHNKELAAQMYQDFRDEIARQREYVAAYMRAAGSGILMPRR